MSGTTPIVLDLDGVILKSNLVKHEAMLSLFGARPHERARISSYILANGGVRRDHKIRHIFEGILGIRPTAEVVAEYLSRYALQLEHFLAGAPIVAGVQHFLASRAHTFYVSSSAPETEVHEQLARRRLEGYFASVFGAGTPKADALRQVSAWHPGTVTVFFGDSIGDWEAAREANVAFVAVVCERDNFVGHQVTKLTDFALSAGVQECIQSALLRHAT